MPLTRPRIPHVGVGCVVEHDGRLLLVRQRGGSEPGAWGAPGGHLDFGETPEACAARETLEESGIVVRDVAFLAITNDLFEKADRHYITVWMRATAVTTAIVIGDPGEIMDAGWFAPDALPAPLFLSFANLLAHRCLPSPPPPLTTADA